MEDEHKQTLEGIRQQINKIDEEIVKLLSHRSIYVEQAAVFKNSSTDVLASDRVIAVIGRVKKLAREHNLDDMVAENIYRAIIKNFTKMEMRKKYLTYAEVWKLYY